MARFWRRSKTRHQPTPVVVPDPESPGWYHHPSDRPDRLRWWDGKAWTALLRNDDAAGD